MSSQYNQPPQYPQQPPQYPPQYAPRYEHADFVRRAVAYIIDMIIIGLVIGAIIVAVAISAISQMDIETLENFDANDFTTGFTTEILLIGFLAFAFVLLYFMIQEGGSGNATIGKKIMHIKVVDTNYQPIDMGKAFLRNVMRLQFLTDLSFLILILDTVLILARPEKQRIGDMVANTYVVNDIPQGPQPYYMPPPPQYQAPPQHP